MLSTLLLVIAAATILNVHVHLFCTWAKCTWNNYNCFNVFYRCVWWWVWVSACVGINVPALIVAHSIIVLLCAAYTFLHWNFMFNVVRCQHRLYFWCFVASAFILFVCVCIILLWLLIISFVQKSIVPTFIYIEKRHAQPAATIPPHIHTELRKL